MCPPGESTKADAAFTGPTIWKAFQVVRRFESCTVRKIKLMTKQFIPLSHEAPDILVAIGGPFWEDAAYVRADMLDDMLEYILLSESLSPTSFGSMPDIYYKLLDIKNSLSGSIPDDNGVDTQGIHEA